MILNNSATKLADQRAYNADPVAILNDCCAHFETVQQEVLKAFQFNFEPAGQVDGLEGRLRQVSSRLREAIATMQQILTVTAAAVSAGAHAALLAHEAEHRISNNLQIVTGLLQQQADSTTLETVRDALQLACARIGAIGQIHATLLARSPGAGLMHELDLSVYLENLCTSLRRAIGMDNEHRKLQTQFDPVLVPQMTAQQLGLVVAELVTNAQRHAFLPARPGTLRVSGICRADGYQLRIEDDGKGMPSGADPGPSGFGLRMVTTLVNQMNAKLSISQRNGTCFELLVPILCNEAAA